MADNKAKRPFSLAQAQPQFGKRRNPNPQADHTATEQMPVKAHAYRAIAELNTGFEKVLQDLKYLQQIGYLNPGRLAAVGNLLARLRADANQDFLTILHQRETANAAHFDGLCRQREEAAGS